MSEQSSWIAQPKRRVKPAKITSAIGRVGVLADWYAANKPDVRRIVVSSADYSAFETQVGTCGISLANDGIRWRGFLIEPKL